MLLDHGLGCFHIRTAKLNLQEKVATAMITAAKGAARYDPFIS